MVTTSRTEKSVSRLVERMGFCGPHAYKVGIANGKLFLDLRVEEFHFSFAGEEAESLVSLFEALVQDFDTLAERLDIAERNDL